MLTTLLLAAAIVLAAATPTAFRPRPFSGIHEARQAWAQPHNASSLEVDLGYSIYRGYVNATANLNIYKGIRFAQAPIGQLRWQAPRAPVLNRSEIIDASKYVYQCPQNGGASYQLRSTVQTTSSEDCLFLNVWSPNNAREPLPVLVWIHGGGYGEGNGSQDLSAIINTNGNAFVGVSIQYRLGAFGFLSSDEVHRRGVVNAGLLDQEFALHWVQQYIHLFGGDPNRVTISGESAGGGSVMLLDMAYGGSIGTQLFQNTIAASPYLPMQYGYNDWIPSQSYYAFAAAAGCDMLKPYGANGTITIFDCLLNKSSETLINASALVSPEGTYGTWAFLPVTDGTYVQDVPSRQLLLGKVNGVNALVGNNADEGYLFTPQNILTEGDLVAWLKLTFPLFSNADIAKLLYYYPASNASTNPNATLYATNGQTGATALNQSSSGTGQQERADLIYAETTFICPSYWLAEAYTDNALGGQGYKYQFSVVPALHGEDVAAYFQPPGTTPYSYDFGVAFQRIWGAFITLSNPSIPSNVANGASSDNTTVNAASTWPPFAPYAPYQVDLNTTCGSERIPVSNAAPLEYCAGPGTENAISLVNAYTWEAGRGTRCDFWRAMGPKVPE